MLAPFSYAVPEEASRLEHLTRLLSQRRLDDERSSCHPSPLVVKALCILGNTWLFQHWWGVREESHWNATGTISYWFSCPPTRHTVIAHLSYMYPVGSAGWEMGRAYSSWGSRSLEQRRHRVGAVCVGCKAMCQSIQSDGLCR